MSEVVALKVSDVDSRRMLLKIEHGKGRKDRLAMLSPQLLELLRDWWRITRPPVWLFPGQNPVNPLTTRQLNRAVHAAAQRAQITKRVTPHTLRHNLGDRRVQPSGGSDWDELPSFQEKVAKAIIGSTPVLVE